MWGSPDISTTYISKGLSSISFVTLLSNGNFLQGPQTYAIAEPIDIPVKQELEIQTYLPPSFPKVCQNHLTKPELLVQQGPQTYALIEPVDHDHQVQRC